MRMFKVTVAALIFFCGAGQLSAIAAEWPTSLARIGKVPQHS